MKTLILVMVTLLAFSIAEARETKSSYVPTPTELENYEGKMIAAEREGIRDMTKEINDKISEMMKIQEEMGENESGPSIRGVSSYIDAADRALEGALKDGSYSAFLKAKKEVTKLYGYVIKAAAKKTKNK